MSLKWKISCGALLCVLSLVLSAAAKADNFDFSFSGDSPYGPSGTITGEIFGLPATGTGAATEVVITSIGGITVNPDSLTVPFSLTSGDGTFEVNSFTDTADTITAADFEWVSTDGLVALCLNSDYSTPVGGGGYGECNTGSTGTNLLNLGQGYGPSAWDGGNGGFSAITFTLVSTPEPGTFSLLFPALLGLPFVRRRFGRS